MRFLKFFIFLSVVIFTVTCSTTNYLEPSRARQLKPAEVRGYHNPAEMKIAWFPYKDIELKKTRDNNWVMVQSDSTKEGALPVIMITYPVTGDSIWIDMNIKSELLGKLVKHTLMTQMPIKQPYGEYLEAASCTHCHPSNVKVNFNF